MMVPVAGPSRGRDLGRLGLMREVLLTLPAAVAYVAGPDLVFEFANDQYRDIVGGRELVGIPYRKALPELAGQGRFEALDRVIATGEPFMGHESELWIRRDGREPEQIFLDYVYQPVRDEAGCVTGVILFGTDVTAHVRDRRRLEVLAGELAAAQERYRTLFQTLPHGVIHYHADGSVIGANPAAGEILGLAPGAVTSPPLERARRAVHEDGSAFHPDELPVMVALRTGEIVTDVVAGVPHGRTGELRWLRITAVPDARDERGRPRRAYAMFTDITEQRRAEAAARESTRLLQRLREANVLGVAVAGEQGIHDANDAFLDMIGYTRDDVESGRLTWDAITPPDWAGADDDAVEQLRRTGACPPYEKEHLHRDGHRVPTLVGAAVIEREPLRWAKFVVDLTARQRAENQRAELLAREQAARIEADNARERLIFLLKAGNLVAATRDRPELLEQVARLAVPTLADYCVVFLPTARGVLRAGSLAHRDPVLSAVLEGLRELDLPLAGPLMVQQAFAGAATRSVTDVGARVESWAHTAPEIAAIVRRLGPGSALAVPLLVGQRPLGVLLLGRGGARPHFTEADVAIIEELARRLAAGLANVETFAREHTVAETLQRAMLPDAPVSLDGLELAVHYLPAADDVHVGGDWYDAFPLGRGMLGLAIGDVAGHSIESASIMGQIRSVLRAYAMDNPAPDDVLRRTNSALSRLLPEAVATVFYAVLDSSTGDLAYANAGHPPALFSSGGRAEYLDSAPGIMLGACDDATFAVAHRRLPPGASLLMYTDGLIEDRHRDITAGLSALALTLARCTAQTPEETCQTVQTALLGSVPRADDVCILAVSLPG